MAPPRHHSHPLRIRDLGYTPGDYPTGPSNSILDVPGVHINQTTVPTKPNLPAGCTATKGVTTILPRPPSRFHEPCAAAHFTFNGNGCVTGTQQIDDWGYINTPLALTNSLSLGTVFDGAWDWVLDAQDKAGFDGKFRGRHYGTPVVGETADWWVNGADLRASRLSREDIKKCFDGCLSREDGGEVKEGQFGGGAGMTCHEFAGGTGTSSRVIGGGDGASRKEGYTIAAICQSNYGLTSELAIGGVPVGKILAQQNARAAGGETKQQKSDAGGRTEAGSIVIILITDAPLATHQLSRLARHVTVGLARVGTYGVGRTHSGDIFVAISTAERGGGELLTGMPFRRYGPTQTIATESIKNESIDTYFYAVAEVVEEAILNSLVGGRAGTVGMDGTEIPGFPVDRVRDILAQHLVKGV